MTLIIATITPSFALVSQDTFTSDLPGDDYDAEIVGDWPVQSACISPARDIRQSLLGPRYKLLPLPALGIVVASSGSHLMATAWAQALVSIMQFGDRFDLPRMAPGFLRQTRSDVRAQWGGHQGFLAVHVGWDRKLDAPIGFAFSSADDFQPVQLGLGHTCMPAPAPDDPEFQKLREMWEPAARGVETQRFHVMLAENAYRSHRRGLCRPGVGIGGELNTARIDRDSMAFQMTHRFPAETEACAAAG